jgi:hypothetical protein
MCTSRGRAHALVLEPLGRPGTSFAERAPIAGSRTAIPAPTPWFWPDGRFNSYGENENEVDFGGAAAIPDEKEVLARLRVRRFEPSLASLFARLLRFVRLTATSDDEVADGRRDGCDPRDHDARERDDGCVDNHLCPSRG